MVLGGGDKKKQEARQQNQQNEFLEPLFGKLMNLLASYLNGESRKNELYLGRHMDFFLAQIADTTVSTIISYS